MKVQYKNETDGVVNIRGKKLQPGESMTSHVFIKQFEEFVKNGSLAVYVDGERIGSGEAEKAAAPAIAEDPKKEGGDGDAEKTEELTSADEAAQDSAEAEPEGTPPATGEQGNAETSVDPSVETPAADAGENEASVPGGDGEKPEAIPAA